MNNLKQISSACTEYADKDGGLLPRAPTWNHVCDWKNCISSLIRLRVVTVVYLDGQVEMMPIGLFKTLSFCDNTSAPQTYGWK